MLLNLMYAVLLLAVSPWLLVSAVRHGKYRQGWGAKLAGRVQVPPATGPRVWLHAVSVGEVNLLTGLTNHWKQSRPDLDVVVSTTTVTGFALAKQRYPADRVFYCPLDFSWAVRRTFQIVKPDLLVLAELELWPNLIAQANRRGVPVAIINGRLSERSHRGYRRFRPLLRPSFSRLSLVAAQDPSYAARFLDMGTPADRLVVTGSSKFDDAPLSRETAEILAIRKRIGWRADQPIFIAGSTQAGEEEIALQLYTALSRQYPQLRLVIVPRHAERFAEVANLIEQAGWQCERWSRQANLAADWSADRVMLVDTIGELRNWWGLADIAFVGGSLGDRGGQNMLEPSGYGAAVCFGPNTQNFREIVQRLLAADAAEVVADEDALTAFVKRMLDQPRLATERGARAQQVVRQHQGATEKTVQLLSELLEQR